MTRHHDERRSEPPMGDGNTRQQRRRDRAGDAGHDLTGNARCGKRECLFAATAEYKRIAALQSHDAVSAPRFANHQPVDRILPDRRTPSAFADEESSRAWCVTERFRVDQRVV